MQLNEDSYAQFIDATTQQLRQKDTISQSKARQYIEKVKSLLVKTKDGHQNIFLALLRLILQIERKAFNFSSRIVHEVWKIFLEIKLRLLLFSKNQNTIISFSQQNPVNLQYFYQKVLHNKDLVLSDKNISSIDDFKVIEELWEKSFVYTDLKSLQYAILSQYVIWSAFSSSQNKQTQKRCSEGSIVLWDKICMYIVKFSERIKQSQTFQDLISLIQRISVDFKLKYLKQICEGLQKLKQSYRLSSAMKQSNPCLNGWQKIVVTKIVCISKKLNKIQDVRKIIGDLQTLRQTYFFEKLINHSRTNTLSTKEISSIMSAEYLEYVLFCAMSNIWVNLNILYEEAIQNQQGSRENLTKQLKSYRACVMEIIRILIKRQISVLMTRDLIRKLQIINSAYAVAQWKHSLSLMHVLLKQYQKNRNIVQFNDQNGYISKAFSSPIKFPFSIYLKVKGQSIPFKQQKILIQLSQYQTKQRILITIRNYEKNVAIFSFVKFVKDDIRVKQQKEIKWNQYESNVLEIVIKSNKIKLFINQDESNCLSIQNTLNKIDEILLCDKENRVGCAISQLFNFKIIRYDIFEDHQKKQIDLVPFIDPRYYSSSKDPMKQNLKFVKCTRSYQYSFVHFCETLGDLQIFMQILYQALKKIKNQNSLLQMVRGVLNLMEQFTLYKDVQHKQLTSEQKQQRSNCILCLSWFYAKQTKSVFIIFQLMRFLYIRGKKDNTQLLKFLCKFSYWKDFTLEKLTLLVMKIKQLLKESSREEQKIANLNFCKKIMFDMILYFKQSHYLMAEKENCLKLHKIILETVYDHVKDILEMPNKKTKTYMVQIFKFIEFLLKLVSCIINRKIHEETFDITFAIELTLFMRDISKLIFVSKQRKYILKADIDLALEVYFKSQEKQLILPLSLNTHQIHEERFNLFLTRIMSETKSLVTIFQTQTFFLEESQLKIYPINSQIPCFCTETKVHSNVVSFNIYLNMLSDKSWSYILFGMPLSQYNERFCESIWRICFYQLFKQQRYFSKVCKMLQQTPLPQSEYCLMKIFEAVLFSSFFQKEYLYRILKCDFFGKSICPFKIQQFLLKYFNKLEPQVIQNTDVSDHDYVLEDKQIPESFQQQKIYYILLHNPNVDFESCKEIIQLLKYRKTYETYKPILYHCLLKFLIKFSHQKIKIRPNQQNCVQSAILAPEATRHRKMSQFQNFPHHSQSPESEIYLRKSNQHAEQKQVPKQLNSTKLQSQFVVICIEALSFYLQSFTFQSIKDFFEIDSKQDIEALKENFVLNVEGIIKTLNSYKNLKGYEFQKYVSFVDVYLKKYSEFLINTRFPSFKGQNEKQFEDSKKARTKYLYKTVHIDLIKCSTQFFVEQVRQRRLELHNLENIWNRVQEKNRFSWNMFTTSDKYYSLSDITTEIGQRLLLKITNDKPKIQLPKMMSKQSVICSVSLISDKQGHYDQSQLSTLFEQSQILKTQLDQTVGENKEKVRKGSTSITKQIKTKKFRVLLINNDKIYQGFLFMKQKNIVRFQETYPNEKLYDKIGATKQEKRDDDEIQKEPKCFNIFLGPESKIFYRKFLFFDAGLEFISHECHNFFCFDSDQKRNKFSSFYLKQHRLFTYEKSKKFILQVSQKWVKGLISNYEYLMEINQHANRSSNDLSQYYVMPWTIIQFDKSQIDKSYIFKSENFRDMKKPLGKIFQQKWKQISQRFKMSFGNLNSSKGLTDSGIQPFLYGSFYSNPAIVSNYMIRLEPFSSFHYHLQSQKIDVADRLFFQFSDQFRSIKNNISDTKQLIPQFYNNPQFLKNRSKLNLGSRQNKQIVNDVRLPKWTQSAAQFVFKMKYFLESPLISKYLSSWIDLIFGIHAKKQNALAADNLYMSEIYGPKEVVASKKTQPKRQSKKEIKQSRNSSILSIQNRIAFYKEFGQLPFTLFDAKHPEFQMIEDYYFFKGTTENLFSSSFAGSQNRLNLDLLQNFCMVFSQKSLEFFDTNSTDYNQKQNFKLIEKIQTKDKVTNQMLVSGQKLSSLLPYLFYVKKESGKICSRYIKKTKIFGSLELKDQFEVCDGNVFNWINDEVLIVGWKSKLKIYSFEECSVNNSDGKVHLIKIEESKPALSSKQFPVFTQHRAQISHIETNNELKLIVSLDLMNKIFILKYYPDRIEAINNFEIKGCHVEQKVSRILVHKMSLIVCLTNYGRLLTFNFYGDLIGAKQLGFKSQGNKKVEKVNCIEFFSKQSSDVLLGTNLGNIWKVDLFEFYKFQEEISQRDLWFERISINTKQHSYDIKTLKVKRYGRHWQIYIVAIDENRKKTIGKVRCLTLKNMTFNLYK